jgi:hypothetical protein
MINVCVVDYRHDYDYFLRIDSCLLRKISKDRHILPVVKAKFPGVQITLEIISLNLIFGVCSSRGHHSFWLCLEQRLFTSSPANISELQL